MKFYTHVSDRYAPFYTKVIAANASEAAHVLDGLMHHESSIDIREHYTDTAGAIDHVFGLCHLLGFRFAPRIRDLADRRLYVVGARAAYTALDPLIGGTIDLRVIADNWDEILRLAASMKAGTVTPSAILRRLAAYPRQNALAKALREIGRLERTLFTLDWISDPALRRRTNAGLNKGEARNALARAVFFHRLGEIRDRTSKISAIAPPASISPSPPSFSGTPSISPSPSTNCVRAAKSFPTSFSPTSPRSAGSISPSTAIMSGRLSRSEVPFGPYEIRAPNSSKPLSVGFGTDSTMTPFRAPAGGVIAEICPKSYANAGRIVLGLARISQTMECIEAANQRNYLCNQKLSWTRGVPRCKRTVSRICSNLKRSKDVR